MKSIFELTFPREEVLQDNLSEEIFAARLKDVLEGIAAPVYQDPDIFFDNTYPTDGLKTLLSEVLGKLTGNESTNNSIIRLETSFGGGKTHNLIALYHIASGKTNVSRLNTVLKTDWQLPQPNEIRIAGIVGSDLDPAAGLEHAQSNVTTYTLWGELGFQLGGEDGYNLVRKNDEQTKTAPGTGLLEKLIGDKPTLIMIDEIARYLRAATGVPTATGKSNLAEQTSAFLMSLLEFAASKEKVVVVLTIASDADAFSKETSEFRLALTETLKVSARQERVLTPTGENEIAAIVVHRLFKHIDYSGLQPIVNRYGEYYNHLEAQGAHIHDRALHGDYLNEFKSAYPLHPELIRVLNVKVATIPNFQRTRGALRLLATAVRYLWKQKPIDTWLIHPYHLDLSQQDILEDLTSRLNRPRFKQVCEADIVSPQSGIPAHAAEVDESLVASGKPHYARRLATVIFLHSLTQGIASGVELPELLLAVATPTKIDGDDPAVLTRTLERLYDTAWFLEYDGYQYRFKTEPSLNKIIADEVGAIGPTRAKQEIDSRIRKIWRTGYLKPSYFPTNAADVDDNSDKPKLAIMHYDAVRLDVANVEPPDLVRKIYEYTGTLETFRTYQNNVLFLVADTDQIDQMLNVVKRYLAINRITSNVERMREFHKEHQTQLKKMGEAAELEVRVAITRTYRYLFYPTSDAPKRHSFLRRETLPPQNQGDTDTDQTNVVVKVLRDLQKVRTADDPVLSGQYIKSKAWDNRVEMTTDELRKIFARKMSLPILLDVNQLKRSVESGVMGGVWLYYDPTQDFAFDQDSPPPIWKINDETRLYLPAEALRLNLRIKGKWQAPMQNTTETAPDDIDEPPSELLEKVLGDNMRPQNFSGQGVPAQAFRQIIDQCQEHNVESIRRLHVKFSGLGKEKAEALKAIGLAIPQLGNAKQGVVLELAAQFDTQNQETLELKFQGTWNRYKRLKQITDAFATEAETMNVTFQLILAFEHPITIDSIDLTTIREVLEQLITTDIVLTIDVIYAAEA